MPRGYLLSELLLLPEGVQDTDSDLRHNPFHDLTGLPPAISFIHMPDAGQHRMTLYSKPDCHLCDVAKDRIDSIRGRVSFELEIVDISIDAGLTERYGERIPVVILDGEEVFAYRVNPKVLESKLGGSRLGGIPAWMAAVRDWFRTPRG